MNKLKINTYNYCFHSVLCTCEMKAASLTVTGDTAAILWSGDSKRRLLTHSWPRRWSPGPSPTEPRLTAASGASPPTWLQHREKEPAVSSATRLTKGCAVCSGGAESSFGISGGEERRFAMPGATSCTFHCPLPTEDRGGSGCCSFHWATMERLSRRANGAIRDTKALYSCYSGWVCESRRWRDHARLKQRAGVERKWVKIHFYSNWQPSDSTQQCDLSAAKHWKQKSGWTEWQFEWVNGL